MRACEEGRAREVEGGEGFGRRGCEAAIVGGTRGRAGGAGWPGCAWNERPQLKLWSGNFGNGEGFVAAGRVRRRSLLQGDSLWVSLGFSLGFAPWIFFGFRLGGFRRRAQFCSPWGGFCSPWGGFGRGSLLAYGEGVIAAGRVWSRTLLQREIYLLLAKFVPRHIFFIALKFFFT